MKTKTFRVVILLMTMVFIVSCGTTKVTMTVKRPSEFNLREYKKIAIGDLTGGEGNHAKDVMDFYTTKLVEANYFEAVVDRQNLKGIMTEFNLGSSGLVDENSAAQLGKFLGAAALVFGRIQTDKYEETTSSDVVERTNYETKTKYNVRVNSRKGQYMLTVHVQLTDVQSSKIIGVKDISAVYTSSTSGEDKAAPPIDVNVLYSECVHDLSKQFMKMVVPYTVTVAAEFENDSKNLPELNNAIQQIKIGETEEALKLLQTCTMKDFEKPEIKAKAYYNYGILLMYSGKYDESLDNLKLAMKINPSNSRYLNAINQAKSEKALADKLQQQTNKS